VDEPVLQTFPIGAQWPTIDPFLFCAHHDDAYPPGRADLGPSASLEGRRIGMDFEGRDGWNMYHGSVVPGFPQHPHRGFETVTYVRKGVIDHADSMGATARFGRGDVQWITAGAGIQHCEMFPLLDSAGPNPLELFQIWLNLPAADKLVDPYFTMFWDSRIPRQQLVDTHGRPTEVTVIAGRLGDAVPPSPPPDSWASKVDSEIAIWHLVLSPGAAVELPVTSEGVIRSLYVFEGGSINVDGSGDGPGTVVGRDNAAVTAAHVPLTVTDSGVGSEVMVLQGRPIGEPVAQQGPFVMNTRAELVQAVDDFRATGFGGWPWHSPDPDHGPDRGRFAIHADGRLEEAPSGQETP
jgi:redox-sensitive bicupin YhaK (pirin superfamily)